MRHTDETETATATEMGMREGCDRERETKNKLNSENHKATV